MRILLIGEFSNVHATLAKGFRELGHEVTVVSNGNGWRNYDRDISMIRERPPGSAWIYGQAAIAAAQAEGV